MDLILRPIDLALKETFQTAHSKRSVQRSLIIELKDGEISGFGEATENTFFGSSREHIIKGIEKVRSVVQESVWDSPEDLHKLLYPYLKNNSFSLCALDQAAYDLYGKKNLIHTYSYLGNDITKTPLTDYTIGIDSIDQMVIKLKNTPWPIYKIKLGTPDDIEIIKELRKHTDSIFRIDANCGWSVEETIKNSALFKPLGVEFIEQPLPPEAWSEMKEVFSHSSLPIIADESCLMEEDVDKCQGHFHGVNIKLTKCGGITPAIRMIKNARSKSLKVMIGCMTESSVGISAIAQLLPLVDYADLDGSLLLANDPATGVQFTFGKASFPTIYGNGVSLKSEMIK